MSLLLRSLEKIKNKYPHFEHVEVSYEKLCELGIGQFTVTISSIVVILAQLGSCIAYLVFIEKSLSDVIPFSSWQILLITAPLYGGACLLRNTSSLSWTSTLGNIAVALGVGVVLYYGLNSEVN